MILGFSTLSTLTYAGNSVGKVSQVFVYAGNDGSNPLNRLFFSINNNTINNAAQCTYNQGGTNVTNMGLITCKWWLAHF